ncbi:MAG: SRPBCC family protein [Candidatus Hydrogenedentes bacterium]|nr:SRPBCC family protein [Candidatus Hydrogenedentota bacterium]
MKLHVLQREQRVPYPVDEVFAFFACPENLARITPPSLGFQILTPSPVTMKEGALIDYTLRMMGMPIHWRTLISRFDPPCCFVDEQLKGPYLFWHHTHTFREDDHGTVIGDEVRYVLPYGPLGDVAHAVYVRRRLDDIFDHRAQVIKQVFS